MDANQQAANHQDDEKLMRQVALGKREQLGVLLRRYASGLLTFIGRMIGDPHRSEELFQEVFLAVWSRRRKYRYPRPFRSWLFGIAANKCRADFRRKAPLPAADAGTSPVESLAAAGPSPVEAAVASETATIVAAAVAQLPPGQRTVVVLRVWNGLSYRQIGEIVDRTEATVRSHMFHGLAAMRRYLEPRL